MLLEATSWWTCDCGCCILDHYLGDGRRALLPLLFSGTIPQSQLGQAWCAFPVLSCLGLFECLRSVSLALSPNLETFVSFGLFKYFSALTFPFLRLFVVFVTVLLYF